MVPNFKRERILAVGVNNENVKGISKANRTLDRRLSRIVKGKKKYGY